MARLEAPAPKEWKEAIVSAKSENAMKVDVLNDISPTPGTKGFPTIPRSLPTAFLEEWTDKREEARRERDRLCGQIFRPRRRAVNTSACSGRVRPPAALRRYLPVATLIRQLVEEAEAALSRARSLVKIGSQVAA